MRARLQVEPLEARSLLATGTLMLTPLVRVSDPSPLPPPDSTTPPVSIDSEAEPQIAVGPNNPAHAVAIWQQDRYFSVGGARALVVSVTADANNAAGAHWSAPAAIPAFDATQAAGSAYARYTDPWVTITPNGTVYAAALAMTPVGPVPGHTAVEVIKGSITITAGTPSISWDTNSLAVLTKTDAPPGTDPADLANDKEMVIADPTDPSGNTVYVVWDRLDHPSDQQNFNAAHGLPFREDMMFAMTTDGGATWSGGGYPADLPGYPAADITNFQANESAFGNEIVVQPNGTLVDVFTHGSGSGNQAAQADHNTVGVLIGTRNGGTVTWSPIIDGPGIEPVDIMDPDTGAPVRDGEPLTSVAVDPHNGNLYAVWADSRFSSKHTYDGIAFSMSTDGGRTWSDPIKVNQTPSNIPAADQQAFTPNVAVNSDGTVAVGYYDFRDNDANPGLPTDYWLVHASGNFTNPSSWTADEKRLTDTSFNIENAAPTSRGYFLGDYEGLAAAGTSFYALFAQAGTSTGDWSNVWFRDPPPATVPAEPSTADDLASLAGAQQSTVPASEASGAWGPVYSSSNDVATSASESDTASSRSLSTTDDDTEGRASSARSPYPAQGTEATEALDFLLASLGDNTAGTDTTSDQGLVRLRRRARAQA